MAARAMNRWISCSIASVGLALGACSEPAPVTDDGLVRVTLRGQTFEMELADDEEERYTGLARREEIPENGGMLFVFGFAAPRAFVMRECVIPIDIAYVDETRRIVSMYTMEVEPPRRPDEAEGNYEARLKRYPSRFPARYVLEFRAGRLEELGVTTGDEVHFQLPASSR